MSQRTIVISRAPDGQQERRRFEDAVVAAIRTNGHNVLIVPHVYYLTSSHTAAVRLAQPHPGGEMVVAAWLHPRAAQWALRAHGIGEEQSPRCCDLGAFTAVEECVAHLAGAGVDVEESPGGHGSVEDLSDPVDERWYPVLDYSRCTACKQCLDFCLFGVYSVEDGQVVASRPEQCRPGCPACARVCPQGAIMFPHCTNDPAIAGAPGMEIEHGTIDVEAFFRARRDGVLGRGEPCPVCGCACDCERAAPGPAPFGKTVCPACGCICDCTDLCECRGDEPCDSAVALDAEPAGCHGASDDLDELIDGLDQLDD